MYIYSTAINAKEAEDEASLVLSRLNGFPLDMPVYTITYHRNVEDFKGFKPLKLDASDLPLEHFDLP